MTQQILTADRTTRSSLRRRGPGFLLVSLLFAGCSAFKSETATTDKAPATVATLPSAGPGKYHHRESQYVFYSDFPLETNLPVFKELGELRDQIYSELKLPPSNTVIQVFLFEDEDRYVKYMRSRYSELPVRRAFFIKQPRNTGGTDDLLVFTYRTEHIRQDLRHELTHGILHSALKDVPLWLDEGLAEVYELPAENNGINSNHLDHLRKNSFQPDLAKLEQLSEVKQMQRPEYRESWAWVHLMLRGKPEMKSVLLSYLQQLRLPSSPGQLLPKLREACPSPSAALLEHLAKMEIPRAERVANVKP